LKSVLENLRPRLKELANGNGKQGLVGDEDKTWRRERLEFVEKEARRHLENVRGLELGEMGEVRDGEWQGGGRKLGKGEVEDLERVVGMAGGREGDPMDES
jgi:kinetochore protein Mis12/MTW1